MTNHESTSDRKVAVQAYARTGKPSNTNQKGYLLNWFGLWMITKYGQVVEIWEEILANSLRI